jgi:hypothetical protein
MSRKLVTGWILEEDRHLVKIEGAKQKKAMHDIIHEALMNTYGTDQGK